MTLQQLLAVSRWQPTWKAGPVNTRCLVIWCRRCTTVPSTAQCTPMRMRGPLQGSRKRVGEGKQECSASHISQTTLIALNLTLPACSEWVCSPGPAAARPAG